MIEPLTAPDSDLRGMEWMPFFGHRLFMSDFEARATDGEFRAALRLWWTAWQQVPAASLPDDDAVLCRLAGLGRDARMWAKIREGALHGFAKCSDGRLYHVFLSKEANEAWDRRVKERERKAAYRAKKDGTGNGTTADVPRDTGGTNEGRVEDVPADKTRQDRTVPDQTPLPPIDQTGQSIRNPDGSLNRAHPSMNQPDDKGLEQVGGFLWAETWARIVESARISEVTFLGTEIEARRWLREGIEPDTIIRAIEKSMRRPPPDGVRSLNFFTRDVFAEHERTKR